jgi:hypothetical protein
MARARWFPDATNKMLTPRATKIDSVARINERPIPRRWCSVATPNAMIWPYRRSLS